MKYCLLIIALLFGYVVNAQEPRLMLPIGHNSFVTDVHFSKDGKRLLTASMDKTVKIWDVTTKALLLDLKGHKNDVFLVRYSPDEKKIVTASADSTVKIWEANTGRLIVDLKGHGDKVLSASFSPDNKKVVTVTENRIPRIWDAKSGMLLIKLDKQSNFPNFEMIAKISDLEQLTTSLDFASFSPDGKKVVTVAQDYSAKVWEVNTGRLINNLKGHTHWVSSVCFSSDGGKILTASQDNTAKIWEVNTGKLITDFRGHNNYIRFADFSPDGKKVITVSGDRKAFIWNATTGALIDELNWASHDIFFAKFSPDSKKVVTTSLNNNTAIIWNSSNGSFMAELRGHKDYILSAAFSSDSKKVATTSWDNTAKIWDATTGYLIADLKGHTSVIWTSSFSPDGRRVVSSGNDVKLWDPKSAILVADLNGLSNFILSSFSPDGKKIVTASQFDKNAKVWDALTGSLITDLKGHRMSIENFSFSPDGRKVVTASRDGTAKVWNVDSGNLITNLKGHTRWVWSANFSPDGKKIVTTSEDQTVKMWDSKSGFIINELKGHTFHVYSAIFSPDGEKIVTASADSTAKIWDAVTGDLIADLKGHSNSVHDAKFSPDASKVLTASGDNTAKVWDANSGSLIANLNNQKGYTTSASFSPDGKKIVTASANNDAIIYDAVTGVTLKVLKGHANLVKIASFSPDGKRVLTASYDNTVKLWNAEDGNELFTFLAIDSNDYFFLIPTGYYKSSQNASKLIHYVTKDLKIIPFEQLDVKYNRPDKVLEAIGNTDTALINSYRKAYQKRIKKLGIDTTQFKDGYSVPESDFINRDAIEYEQTKDKLTLKIKAVDSTYKLERFNVWVNEVPLFGLRGVRIKRSNNFDTTITITLSQGENRIETSITNANGTESYKMPLFVKYTPAKPIEEKQYFIGIGINQFANLDYNLSWSVKDIRDLALKLKTKYPNIIIDTLFDSNVTRENILALKQKLLQLKEDDKVIVSYSGHGVLSKDFDYFLSTYSIDFSNPSEKGLAYDDLESLLDNIKPRKKLMLIDACHSGEVDKEEIAKIEAAKSTLNNNGVTTKSTIKVVKKEKQLGMSNSFELMQSLFVNVGKGTGATIISAAGGMQYAQERGDLKNGVFTYSLIEAFNNNSTLNVSELKKKVGERVTQLTNGLQKPTSRNETNNYDWVIW